MKLTAEISNTLGALIDLLRSLESCESSGARILHISSYPQNNAKTGFNLEFDRDIYLGYVPRDIKVQVVDKFPLMYSD